MKRILLPLVALSIALTSCSRDNDDVINNPITNPVKNEDTGILPTTLNTSGLGYPKLSYNETKLANINGIHSYNFTYTGDAITSAKILGIGEVYYNYNTDGTLNSVLDSNKNEIRKYTYNNDGTIEMTDGANRVIYTMRNGNLIKEEGFFVGPIRSAYSGLKHTYTINYEYDNKNNPFKNVKGFSALALEFYTSPEFDYIYRISEIKFELGDNVFANNITKIEVKGVNERHSNEEYRETRNITYKYNDKGYPTDSYTYNK